jgi:hypothetical protein
MAPPLEPFILVARRAGRGGGGAGGTGCCSGARRGVSALPLEPFCFSALALYSRSAKLLLSPPPSPYPFPYRAPYCSLPPSPLSGPRGPRGQNRRRTKRGGEAAPSGMPWSHSALEPFCRERRGSRAAPLEPFCRQNASKVGAISLSLSLPPSLLSFLPLLSPFAKQWLQGLIRCGAAFRRRRTRRGLSRA